MVGAVLILVLRGWVVGTYVNDDAVSIERLFVRTTVPWADVASIEVRECRCWFLGLPVITRARAALVVQADGTRHRTHISTTSPDLWLRPEAFDMAVLRLQRWK